MRPETKRTKRFPRFVSVPLSSDAWLLDVSSGNGRPPDQHRFDEKEFHRAFASRRERCHEIPNLNKNG